MQELAKTTNEISDHVGDHDLRKTTERKAMNTGAEALLDRSDAALNFVNMAVSQDDVHCDGADVLTHTVKFVVGMDVAHVEASRTIQVEGSVDFNKHGFVCAVRYRADGAETDAT